MGSSPSIRPVIMLVHSRLEWHSLQVPKSVCWLVVRKRGKAFCDSAERHHSRLHLHLGQLLRSQRGLIDVYERLLPLVINIHVSPCHLPLLPPEWRKIHLSACLSVFVKVELSLAFCFSETIDRPHPVRAAVPRAHLMENNAVSDVVNLPHLHLAAGHILVRVPVPVLCVGLRCHLRLCSVLGHLVPEDGRHGPASNLNPSNKPSAALVANVVQTLPEDWRELFLPDNQVTAALGSSQLIGDDQGVFAHVVLTSVLQDQGGHPPGVMNLCLLKAFLAWKYRLIVEVPAELGLRLCVNNSLKEDLVTFLHSSALDLGDNSWGTPLLGLDGESSLGRTLWDPVNPHWVLRVHCLVDEIRPHGVVVIHDGWQIRDLLFDQF